MQDGMVEPPIAISRAKSIIDGFFVTNIPRLDLILTRSIRWNAALRTSSRRSCENCQNRPFPGNANPKISKRQFIELAVNMPAQEPQVGQAFFP